MIMDFQQMNHTAIHSLISSLENENGSLNYFQSSIRILAGGGGDLEIDYTVFGMVLVTMIFLLVVAAIRHKIDHLVRGRDFFESVLEACYHELSTLGIVEALVFIIHKYYVGPSSILQTERVFGEVHFTLFFVVIINAVMSTLLYLLSTRVANSQWVRMENIDLDHYVAVRRQFEDVDKKLKILKTRQERRKGKKDYMTTNVRDSDAIPDETEMREHGVKTMFEIFWTQIVTKKLLKRRQKELLLQVRFHELRVHFIESNNLPGNFRVSDYLKLCMDDEFKNLVNISTWSWYTLIFITNIVYYVMGIVYSNAENGIHIGNILSISYFVYSLAFILVSGVVAFKMKQILFKIIKDDKWLNKIHFSEEEINHQSKHSGSMGMRNADVALISTKAWLNQNGLFWFSTPRFVIILAQLGQFGYAISFAILLVFNQTIDNENYWYGWYAIVPLLCYLMYMMIWSRIMPKYTQCTSLGELLRKSHLVDIDARSKLEKAKKEKELENIEAESEGSKNMKKRPRKREKQVSIQSKLFSFMSKEETLESETRDDSLSNSQRLNTISRLVKQETKNLPDQIVGSRRPRTKSKSEGVAAMRLFSSVSASAEEALKGNTEVVGRRRGKLENLPASQTGTRRPRQKMMSTGVVLMQSEAINSFFLKDDIQPLKVDTRDKEMKISVTKAPLDVTSLGNELQNQPEPFQSNNIQLKSLQEVPEDNHYLHKSSDGVVADELSVTSEESIERQTAVSSATTTEPILIEERLCRWILHKSYSSFSAIFGTMVILFFLSLRIEILLLDTCVLEDNLNTFNFIPNRVWAFWLTIAWFCLFGVESCLTCLLLGRKNRRTSSGRDLQGGKNGTLILAALLDIALTVTCLGLFLWAEASRCCKCHDASVFFRAEVTKDYDCIVPPDSKCCPTFGSRLCNGVGVIEPYACLIIMRVFRFEFARRVISTFNMCKKFLGLEGEDVRTSEDEGVQGNTSVNDTDEAKIKIDFEHQTGTIAELWIMALNEYPELVQMEGIFSKSLLESMLGVYNPLPLATEGGGRQIPSDVNKVSTEGVPPIESLRVKKPMGLQRGISVLSIRSIDGSSIHDLNGPNDNFVSPASPLIRSMRRCECKWKWLRSLDNLKWDIVDVVLTEYEIVWFDATSIPTFLDGEQKKVQSMKDAIASKKGGKGLRLNDVAVGREALGRISLTDIDCIKIQRLSPDINSVSLDEVRSVMDLEENQTSRKRICKEYWIDDTESSNILELPLQKEWEKITEDRLRLHSSKAGTLHLRFLIDLYQVVEPNMSTDDMEKKQGALLWCESISHHCTRTQLKQKLPHFGQHRDEELPDFIEIVDRNNDSYRNNASMWNLRRFKI